MNKILITILLLVSMASLNAQEKDFYKKLDLTNEQRISLAESYKDAGRRFIDLGQKDRGNYYLNLAKEIEATIIKDEAKPVEDNITEVNTTDTEASTNSDGSSSDVDNKPVDTAKETTPVEETSKDESISFNSNNEIILEELPFDKEEKLNQNAKADKSILASLPVAKKENLETLPVVVLDTTSDKKTNVDAVITNYFNALLKEDFLTIDSLMGEIVAYTGYEKPLTSSSRKTLYEEMFSIYQFNNLHINDVYDYTTKQVTILDGDSNRAIVTIKAKDQAPAELTDWQYFKNFFGTTHYYFVEKFADKWSIIAFDIDSDNKNKSMDINAK